MAFIRRALVQDAFGIHQAHMLSIQQLCANDYTEKQIQAWGHRPFEESLRRRAIEKERVWVVEDDKVIKGYAQLEIVTKNGFVEGYIWGLYLTRELQGQGFGRQLCDLMLTEAAREGAAKVRLDSTLTAYAFYKTRGFLDAGPELEIQVRDAKIRCRPMVWRP